MGFGAIAGLAGAAISAGVSAAGSAGLFSGGGPNLGGYSSTLNKLANQYVTPYANNPSFWNVNVPSAAEQSISFGLNQAPNINQFQMNQLQDLLGQALPGYQGMVGQMTTNTNQLLQGQVPTDVQNQINRAVAQGGLSTGIGGVSGVGAGLTRNAASARSLGLNSLALQQQGFTQGTNLMQMASSYMMPQMVNPLSLLPTSDLVNAQEWSDQAQYQASLSAYTAKANAAAARVGAPSPSPIPGIAGAVSGLNQAFGAVNPQTGKTGYQTIGGLLGFNGGGGGSYSGDSLGTLGDESLIGSLGLS